MRFAVGLCTFSIAKDKMKICKICKNSLLKVDFDYRIDRQIYRNACKSCRRNSQNARNIRLYPNATGKQKRKLKVKANSPEFKLHYGVSYNSFLKRENPQHYLRQTIRKRINTILKQINLRLPTEKMLGCSLEELKLHLESLFVTGMTWDNYGRYGWHIDHIKPLSLFDLCDPNQQSIACHYTNLQPLWAKDNLSKGNKF